MKKIILISRVLILIITSFVFTIFIVKSWRTVEVIFALMFWLLFFINKNPRKYFVDLPIITICFNIIILYGYRNGTMPFQWLQPYFLCSLLILFLASSVTIIIKYFYTTKNNRVWKTRNSKTS